MFKIYKPTNLCTVLPNPKTLKRREQRKRAKNKMFVTAIPVTAKKGYGQGYEDMIAQNKATKEALGAIAQFYTLGSITTQSVAKTIPENKENPMYIDYVSSDKHTESARTNYLLSRLSNTKSNHRDDLYKQFGLVNDTTPSTAKELIDRIASGKYILPTDAEEKLTQNFYGYGLSSILNAIKWRDPAVKEDRDGYNASDKEMELAATDAHDMIMSGVYTDGLAAIKTFEAWKPTAATATAL